MSLYFVLLLGSISIPLVLSFDKRLQFYKSWKYLFPSIFMVALVYILVDIKFTRKGIWGFNPFYHSEISLAGLPLEEVLFFIVIPYASIFLHESIIEYFPGLKVSRKWTKRISMALLAFSLIVMAFHYDKSYTSYILLKTIFILSLLLFVHFESANSFMFTFLVILIPFVIVNGILTGSFIENEVVWYNNTENVGVRFFTIPVEDFAYAFTLILYNLFLVEKLKKLY